MAEVRAAAAYRAVGGIGDIDYVAVQAGYQFFKGCIQSCRRHAFVASAVKRDGRMTADLPHIIVRIVHEEFFVIRIRAVGRIGQPEILPDHDAVTVAGLIEFLIAGLPDPVAYHVEIEEFMIPHDYIIIARSKAQIQFAEAPVAAESGHSPAVDPGSQPAAFHRISHLAKAGLER